MKNRPLKHKTNNAFKFKSFSERVAEVDVRRSALYHVEHENEALDEKQTYFHQTILKWSVLNLSEEFLRFQSRVRDVITLPQLLHKKELVINHLFECLEDATQLSLQPLLEFIVVLAKDLREEFYPYFPRFFDKLISLLNTQEADQLEWTLLCLAFIFKSLRGFLRKDISLIFNKTLLLLDDGQKLHITNFAAECFSFVARDIKDKRALINLVTSSIKNNPNAVMGCGRLFFEIMRGVNQQFHSCTESFLTLCFETLLEDADEHFDPEILFQVLVQSITDMMQCISPESITLFWKVAHNVLDKSLEGEKLNENGIKYLINLMGQVIEYRHGKYLDNVSLMIQKLVKAIDLVESEEIIMNITQISTLMMLSRNLDISQLDASRLSKKMMSINTEYRNVFEQFVAAVIDYSQFEILILPDFLKYFEKYFDSQSLELLAEIVLKKSPLSRNGINLDDWKQFPIVLRQNSTQTKFTEILNKSVDEIFDDPGDFLRTAAILPHLVNFEADAAINTNLEQIIVKLCEKFTSDESEKRKSCFIISILVETLIHSQSKGIKTMLIVVDTVLPVCSLSEHAAVLNILDISLTYLRDCSKKLDEKLFNKIHSALKENLASPHHEVRLLTSHIFTLFDHLEILHLEDENLTLFDVFHRVETIEPTIRSYRDQIMLLQKLGYDSTFFQQIKEGSYRMDAMRYVMSILYVNFSLLWPPALEILKTYAEELAVNEFWSTYKQQLDTVESSLNQVNNNEEDFFEEGLLNKNYEEFFSLQNKADHVNYRFMLLKSLSEYKKIFEAKNRDVVTMFFEFVEQEYRYSQNKNEDNEAPKATQKILITYLTIFSKFSSPKNIYKSRELYEFYIELLTHRSADVQKLALDCILVYKDPYLIPYKENLYKLVNDLTINQELLSFFSDKMDGEGYECAVLDEHRDKFVPFVMKLLHTKMTLRTTKQELKPAILRFIGKFREEEIFLFTKMAFGTFESLLKDSPLDTLKEISGNDVNYENVMGTSKMQSLMNLIQLIKTEFAGLKNDHFIRHMLHIKLCMDSILFKMDNNSYKPLKSKSLLNLVDFFDHFDKYAWTEAEIDTIFEIHVWPILEKLPSDCIHKPTPLLKLFMIWSKNPRYYVLFTKHKGDDKTMTPLPFIFKLLNGPRTSSDVQLEIMNIISEMLTLQTEVNDFSIIQLTNCVKIDETKMKEKDLNLGSTLLLPYIPEVLNQLRIELKQRRTISKENLLILSKTTELVTDFETCDTLIMLLLPITIRRIESTVVDADTVRQMLTAIHSLIKQVEVPQKYIRQLGPFFEYVTDISARKTLCQILENIATMSPEPSYTRLCQIITDMNAMNKKWLDQPDFGKRLNAFRVVDNLTQNKEIDVDLAILFLYQCFYYLKNDKDLAIRDNSSFQVKNVCVTVIKICRDNPVDHKYFIEKVVLSALNKGIKNKNENARNDIISLLGELARECSEDHRVFKDLNQFTNIENREIDFFDNMTHMQLHRHRKAMTRFHKMAGNITTPLSSQALVNYIIPIVSTYLCCEKYRKKSKVTDAAGNCIGIVSNFLPWNHYKSVLKLYLGKLKRNIEYQKQIIKIICSILEGFHFELSKIDVKEIVEPVKYNKEAEEDKDGVKDKENGEEAIELSADLEVVEFKPSSLSKEQSDRIIYDISRILIPDLFTTINFKVVPDAIKLNERRERYAREKEEMLKIPIAIAIVKLLQKLPKHLMDINLPKLVIKVANFLRSNLKQVRNVSRLTLKTMVACLGVDYFDLMLENLMAILKQGFQCHVLTVTINTLLDALQNELKAEKVDGFLQDVLKICVNDIFGRLSEEKEVNELTRRTPEAKPSKRSFLTLNILAKNMSEKSILDLIMPFKDILIRTHSRKVVTKVEEVFHQIVDGITKNSNISLESMLIFVFGITSDSIPYLLPNSTKRTLSEKEKNRMKRSRPDIFLIQAEPKRRGAYNQLLATTSAKTNAHVLVELGLEMLCTLIKRKHVQSLDYQAFLDPLVGILIDTLSSSHLKVTILGIKCVSAIWSTKLEMPSFEENTVKIVDDIFKILHKYATAGIMRKDDNYILVRSAFRSIVMLLRYVKYFTISEDQLKVLLLYVEQDLYNPDKQPMAFILLKSIVARKLMVEEMSSIMQKVAEISINSEVAQPRQDARAVFLQYIMEYPLGDKIDKTLNFFVNQLNYEVISGRESAIAMLTAIFRKFPLDILNKKAGFFFLSIGIRLINDESTNCRILVAECLEILLSRIDKNQKNELFELILAMLSDRKLSHREMAAQLCIRLINVEKESFSTRLEKILPVLISSLMNTDPNGDGKFVKLHSFVQDFNDDNEDEDKALQKQKALDHALIQALNAIEKIFEVCVDVLSNEKYSQFIDEIAYSLQKLLAYGHIWVRQESLKLLGIILSTIDYDVIHKLLNGSVDVELPREFIYSNPILELKSLTMDMCAQLLPGETDEETASQIVQNLLYIANVIKVIPLQGVDDLKVEEKREVNMFWLVRRMRYVIQGEVSKAPSSIILRKNIFNWMEALIALLDEEDVAKLAPSLLSPIIREITDEEHIDDTMKQLALSLGNNIKSKIGGDEYDRLRIELQNKLMAKRMARRRFVAMDKINNPIKAAKRKITVQLKKKEAKKRKRDIFVQTGKMTTKPKKRRMEDLFE